jgi:hypothetical protein
MCLGSLDVKKIRIIKATLSNCINDLINNHRDILCKCPEKDFTRNRDFTAMKTISTLIRFESKNAESELIRILHCENSAKNINAAFLQQRKKLTEECFPYLFRQFSEALTHDKSLGICDKLCYGMHVLAADGSDVNVAYNPNDPLTYIEKKEKRGYNQIHLNAMYDVCTGMWMAASIQGIHKKQERKALVEMIGQLQNPEKCIITADRGYESYNVFAACKEVGAKFVIRLKDIESNGIISSHHFPDEEFDCSFSTTLTKKRTKETTTNTDTYTILPYYTDFDFFDSKEKTYNITLRIVRFRLPNGSYVAVATNLDKNKFSMEVIREIYHRRWSCEVGFRCLKYTIGLVNFHSWKMQYIKQEVFARLILHNFCSAVISTISPREQNKTEDVPTEDVSSVSEDKNDCEKKRGIAFTNAVTVCRELLDNNKAAFIKRAIQTIRAHTYEYKVNRTYTRNVKPKSNKPFGYKAS